MAEFESQITVDEIVDQCGTKLELLETKCEEEKLLTLAEYCDPIIVVGHALGLTKAQVSAIDNDYRTIKEKRLALMQVWKESFAFRATYKKFIEALLASGKADQATEVCRLLVQRETKDEVDTTADSSINTSLDSATACLEITEHDTVTQCDGLSASASEVIETQEDILPSPSNNPPPSNPHLADQHEADSNSESSDSSSSSDERSVLEAKIYSLEEEYRIIGENLTDTLEQNKVSMNDLQKYAANLPLRIRRCYEELRENQLVDKATAAKSIGSFVGVLNIYSNFLNATLLGDAVKKFGDKATKSQMRAYNKKLKEFQESTTLVQFVTECSWKGVTPKGYEEIELVLETDWEEKTLKDIAPPKQSWLLKKVYYGSLRVVFSIANLRDLEEEDVREYFQRHVKRVFVNGKCILNFESEEAKSGQTASEENETVQLTKIPSGFRFSSESHGKAIILSEDGLEARRTGVYYTGVYVATPLQGTCEFEVELTDCSDNSIFALLKIGVSQRPTGTYKHLDIPHKIWHTTKDSCVWLRDSVYNGLSGDVIETKYGSMHLGTGYKVAVRLFENGDLHFFLNGVDQGLASRNVYREGWDIYPVIHLYGSGKAVRITRAVLSEYAKGHRGQQSSENISPHSIQFKFHPVTGENIMLLEDGLYARRLDSSSLGGVVYGAMPIKQHGIFEVIITEYEHSGNSSIRIGVMRRPTNTELEQSDVPNFSATKKNYFVWREDKVHNNLSGRCDDDGSAYGREKLLDLREGDKVGLRLSTDGTLSFFVNGKNQGVAVRELHQEGYDIYPMLDITFNCHAVKITRAETHSEDKVPDLQELCVEKIASCLDWSSKDVNILPLPQRLKNQIEQYIDYL